MEKVELNKDMKLSEHFTLGEVTKTSYKTEEYKGKYGSKI